MFINDVNDPGGAEALSPEYFEKYCIVNRTKFHRPYYRNAEGRTVPYNPKRREKLRGITLHQTACHMGLSHGRWDTLGAHFAVLRNGEILKMADPWLEVIHGNGWNAQCLGIEYDGLLPGLLDDPRTAHDESMATTWDDPTTKHREQPMVATPEQLLSGRRLLRYLKWRYPEIVVCGAHRQSSGNRQNDPGQQIWNDTAEVRKQLGFSDGGPGFKIGSGRPIPEAWDPVYVGERY